MKCSEIIDCLNRLAPERMACDWDNPGLLAGRREKEVEKIYLALDATDRAVELAIEAGADMLITHHPLIFKGIKNVSDDNFTGSRLIKLIQRDMAYYAMHTNFDAAPGCMADLAAERLGLKECQVLEVMGEAEGIPYGIGKLGQLEEALSVTELAKRVKEAFGLPFITVYSGTEVPEMVTRVAVSPGSGSSMISPALGMGAQVLVTGDIGHHQGIDAVADHMAVLDAGHYGLEHIFMDFMEDYLRRQFGGNIEVVKSPLLWPAVVI